MKPKVRVKGINLLPKEYIQAQQIKKYILIAAALILLECLLFLTTVVMPTFSQKKYEQNILLELELMKGNPKFSEVNQVLKELEDVKAQLKVWNDQYAILKQGDFINTSLLDSLVARLPVGITIDTLSLASSEQAINISGRTENTEQLLNYVIIVENIFKDAKVEFDVAEAQKDTQETKKVYPTYTITITLPSIEVAAEEAETQQTTDPALEVAPLAEQMDASGGANE